MTGTQLAFYHLSVALAIGLMIGLERGWEERAAEEGARIAGVRTYGLIGLLGGVSCLLAARFGPLVIGLVFVGLTGMLTAAYVVNLRDGKDVGVTSLVAGLLTFILGALAAGGEMTVAAAAAVVTTLLLSYKRPLHHWISRLEGGELRAGIRLLLISVVLLPIFPNRGYGPWQALNPYTIWWMVVLVAAISFVGYFAIKIGGARRGSVFTGLFSGLASSTALTLHFSRLSRQRDAAMASILAMGVLLACGTMFPRMLLVASLVNPALFKLLLVPAAVMALICYLPVLWYWRVAANMESGASAPLKNPLELTTALGFGLLLALVMLLGKALQTWFGETGVLALSAASGVADVDAITLSLARMSRDDLTLRTAVSGIVIAAGVNSLVKSGMAVFIGGRAIGFRVGLPLLGSTVGGAIAVWLWVL